MNLYHQGEVSSLEVWRVMYQYEEGEFIKFIIHPMTECPSNKNNFGVNRTPLKFYLQVT